MRLKFACGCLWIIGSGLACCATHDAPYRKIEEILPLTLVGFTRPDGFFFRVKASHMDGDVRVIDDAAPELTSDEWADAHPTGPEPG